MGAHFGREIQMPRHYSRRASNVIRAARLTIEELECRRLLTSNLYLDFGDAFPAGGLQMSVLTLRDAFGSGGLQGPDLNNPDNAMTPANEAFTDATNITMNPTSGLITYDYNTDGLTNGTD